MKAGPKAFESLRRENADLRRKLQEAKLVNRQLSHAIKLTQLNLTMEQKRVAAGKLKEAKTVREADMVFEAFKASVEKGNNQTINEGRVRPGSSSRVTGSSSPKLNESANRSETDTFARWNQLAGTK
jgi:hypothetical protein